MDNMLRIGDVSIDITNCLDDILSQFMQNGWVVTKDIKVDNGRSICMDFAETLYIVLIGDLSGHIELLRLQGKDVDLLSECGDLYLCGISKEKLSERKEAPSPDYTASWNDTNAERHVRHVWRVGEMLCAVGTITGVVRYISVAGKSYEDELPHVIIYNKRPICIGKPAPYKMPNNRNIVLTLDDNGVVKGIRCLNFGVDDYNIPTLAEEVSISKVLGNWYRASTPNGTCVKLESDKYNVMVYFKDSTHIESVDMKAVI